MLRTFDSRSAELADEDTTKDRGMTGSQYAALLGITAALILVVIHLAAQAIVALAIVLLSS